MQWLILIGFAIIAFVLWQIWSDRQSAAASTSVVVEQPGDWWGPWFGPWWNSGGDAGWWFARGGSGGYGPNGYGPRGWWPRPHHGPYPHPPGPKPSPGPGPGPRPGGHMLGPGGTRRMLGSGRQH
jgi:hypothetical protein